MERCRDDEAAVPPIASLPPTAVTRLASAPSPTAVAWGPNDVLAIVSSWGVVLAVTARDGRPKITSRLSCADLNVESGLIEHGAWCPSIEADAHPPTARLIVTARTRVVEVLVAHTAPGGRVTHAIRTLVKTTSFAPQRAVAEKHTRDNDGAFFTWVIWSNRSAATSRRGAGPASAAVLARHVPIIALAEGSTSSLVEILHGQLGTAAGCNGLRRLRLDAGITCLDTCGGGESGSPRIIAAGLVTGQVAIISAADSAVAWTVASRVATDCIPTNIALGRAFAHDPQRFMLVAGGSFAVSYAVLSVAPGPEAAPKAAAQRQRPVAATPAPSIKVAVEARGQAEVPWSRMRSIVLGSGPNVAACLVACNGGVALVRLPPLRAGPTEGSVLYDSSLSLTVERVVECNQVEGGGNASMQAWIAAVSGVTLCPEGRRLTLVAELGFKYAAAGVATIDPVAPGVHEGLRDAIMALNADDISVSRDGRFRAVAAEGLLPLELARGDVGATAGSLVGQFVADRASVGSAAFLSVLKRGQHPHHALLVDALRCAAASGADAWKSVLVPELALAAVLEGLLAAVDAKRVSDAQRLCSWVTQYCAAFALSGPLASAEIARDLAAFAAQQLARCNGPSTSATGGDDVADACAICGDGSVGVALGMAAECAKGHANMLVPSTMRVLRLLVDEVGAAEDSESLGVAVRCSLCGLGSLLSDPTPCCGVCGGCFLS